jgi:hypothetical protein
MLRLKETHHWCSAAAIQNWLISQNGYYLCDKRIIPVLSHVQQKSHMTFLKYFGNNWLGSWSWKIFAGYV